jgi:hypothetical protein
MGICFFLSIVHIFDTYIHIMVVHVCINERKRMISCLCVRVYVHACTYVGYRPEELSVFQVKNENKILSCAYKMADVKGVALLIMWYACNIGCLYLYMYIVTFVPCVNIKKTYTHKGEPFNTTAKIFKKNMRAHATAQMLSFVTRITTVCARISQARAHFLPHLCLKRAGALCNRLSAQTWVILRFPTGNSTTESISSKNMRSCCNVCQSGNAVSGVCTRKLEPHTKAQLGIAKAEKIVPTSNEIRNVMAA